MDWVPVEILFLGFAAPFERNLNRLAPQKAGEFSEIGVTAAADDWHPWVGMTWRY